MYCPKCGAENRETAIHCNKCGFKLSETPTSKTPTSSYGKPSTILLVIGYIFALLGGIIGVIIGLYLYTRGSPEAKSHGLRIFQIAMVVFVISLFLRNFVFK